jgi:hypothetical protein
LAWWSYFACDHQPRFKPDLHPANLWYTPPSFHIEYLTHHAEVISVAKPSVEIQIPKDLGLTKTQMSALQKSFQKQLVDTLKGKQTATKAKSKQIIVDVRAKSKSEIV